MVIIVHAYIVKVVVVVVDVVLVVAVVVVIVSKLQNIGSSLIY